MARPRPWPRELFADCILGNEYGKMPYLKQEMTMTTTARFDLKMDAADKDIVSRAATLMGTTMASFVRVAAKEKAQALLDRESWVTLSAAILLPLPWHSTAPSPPIPPSKAH
ncbi:DUF1778 domain-containing protein [Polaromonas sp. P1-6]|nr:DUF1778 domain-containing protein [Polaromonas sp. P1-6]